MAAVRGKDFKLYRNSATPETPTWVEVTNVRDLSRGLTKVLADASIRGSTFRLQLATLKELSIEFQMVYDQADASYVALEDAFFEDTSIDLAILDGSKDTVGSKGIRFMGQVSDFGTDENLEEIGQTNVTIVPAYETATANLPRRVEVATAGTIANAS